MITHPFAARCDRAIADLVRLRESLLAQKKIREDNEEQDDSIPEGYWMDNRGKLHRLTRLTGEVIQLPGVGNQIAVNEGGGYTPERIKKMGSDKTLRALEERLAKEAADCDAAYRASQTVTPGSFDSGRNIFRGPQRHGGQRPPCPGYLAAQKALEAYLRRTYGNKGFGPQESGGGGGGGF